MLVISIRITVIICKHTQLMIRQSSARAARPSGLIYRLLTQSMQRNQSASCFYPAGATRRKIAKDRCPAYLADADSGSACINDFLEEEIVVIDPLDGQA